MTRLPAAVAALIVAAFAVGGCSSQSSTTELATDRADVTVPGPAPTAPPAEGRAGLSRGANALLDEIESLQDEGDLCRIISGEAFDTLLSDEFNTAGLVTSPAGLAQLIVMVDDTFTHLVVIAPPEVQPAMQTVKEIWSRLAVINGSAPDAEAQVNAILAEPQVAEANQSIRTWAALNCAAALADAQPTAPA